MQHILDPLQCKVYTLGHWSSLAGVTQWCALHPRGHIWGGALTGSGEFQGPRHTKPDLEEGLGSTALCPFATSEGQVPLEGSRSRPILGQG